MSDIERELATAVRDSHLSTLGDIRDRLTVDFGTEEFSERLAAARIGLDTAVHAIDALYQDGRALLAPATNAAIGEAAMLETQPAADPAPVNPSWEAAPGNMTTDPGANPRLLDDPAVAAAYNAKHSSNPGQD
jgi:hypothetical protein